MQMQDENTGRVLGGCFEVFFEIWGIPWIKYNNLTMLMRILSSEFPCYGPPRETSISEEETQQISGALDVGVTNAHIKIMILNPCCFTGAALDPSCISLTRAGAASIIPLQLSD